MPWSSVTRIQAAPIRSRYSWAWARTWARSRLVSSRSRNWGTRVETWLRPASARVRAARKSATARRVFASARWMDSSAVRLARSDVTPNVAPSTATTSSAEARKILAASPKRTALVPLEPVIRGIVLAVLVLVGHPSKAAGVELNREVGDPRGADHHLPRDFGSAVVPDVQRVAPGRHSLDGKTAVRRRLGEEASRHHQHEGHHAGVDVAEYPHQARAREGVTLCVAAPVLAEVELVRIAHREHVVVEGIVIGELHLRPERYDQHARHELLLARGDLERTGAQRGRRAALEVNNCVTDVARRLAVLLKDRDVTRHAHALSLDPRQESRSAQGHYRQDSIHSPRSVAGASPAADTPS